MYARDKMDSKETRLAPIPVDFVIEQGLNEHTEAKRRPYRTLITTWANHEGMPEQGETIASQLNTGKEIERLTDLQDLLHHNRSQISDGREAEIYSIEPAVRTYQTFIHPRQDEYYYEKS